MKLWRWHKLETRWIVLKILLWTKLKSSPNTSSSFDENNPQPWNAENEVESEGKIFLNYFCHQCHGSFDRNDTIGHLGHPLLGIRGNGHWPSQKAQLCPKIINVGMDTLYASKEVRGLFCRQSKTGIWNGARFRSVKAQIGDTKMANGRNR